MEGEEARVCQCIGFVNCPLTMEYDDILTQACTGVSTGCPCSIGGDCRVSTAFADGYARAFDENRPCQCIMFGSQFPLKYPYSTRMPVKKDVSQKTLLKKQVHETGYSNKLTPAFDSSISPMVRP